MRFATPLLPGRLVRRYKRFLADVVLDDGTETTAHVANSGAMLGLDTPGARVFLSRSLNPARKLALSWELVEADFGAGPELVGVNTMHPNLLVAQAIAAGAVPALAGYARMRREVKYGRSSRIDIQLEDDARPLCLVEVKNVHLMRAAGRAEFPDCVTARGAKHLDELAREAARGNRAVMVYISQIGSARSIGLARDLDPGYGRAFDRTRAAGIEVIGLVCRITPEAIEVAGEVPMTG
ncbi:DNA/RNA nuclease SfsA [Xanthobacter sp. KR7-65]|uniref:DNA/RNA nuclease SfsA n=1 Tax=Xanthobacter sp. KR7-65 TaxID=3156612 RepID=UPI0032B56C6B